MLQAVAEEGAMALQYAAEHLTAERAFMSAACRQDGRALRFASRELRGDAELVRDTFMQEDVSDRERAVYLFCNVFKGDIHGRKF